MANSDHLKILDQGVNIWNQWRKKHPDREPDLSGANFHRAYLVRVNLCGAKLANANFNGANLTRSRLDRANLSEANFYRANLRGASLHMANLDKTKLYETILTNTDLTAAKNLETCIHNGPSTIDHRTLAKSGQLPLAFLRGFGLPDVLINYLPTLLNEPFQFYSCFISYSHQDEDFTKRLHEALQANGIRCWYAPEDTQGGKKLHEQIDEAIHMHDKLLLVLSEHSMNSEWVKTELANARQREIRESKRLLFPIRLVDFETIRNWSCFDADTGKDSAREIREYYIPDFSNWKDHDSFEQEFAKLIRDLKNED